MALAKLDIHIQRMKYDYLSCWTMINSKLIKYFDEAYKIQKLPEKNM